MLYDVLMKEEEVCMCQCSCKWPLQSPLSQHSPESCLVPLVQWSRKDQTKCGCHPGKKLFSPIRSWGIKHGNFCLLRGKAGIFLCIISSCGAKGWKFILKIHNSCLKCLCLVPAIPPEWPRDIYKTSIIF